VTKQLHIGSHVFTVKQKGRSGDSNWGGVPFDFAIDAISRKRYEIPVEDRQLITNRKSYMQCSIQHVYRAYV